jgi:formate-dependent nitrite reductase membrane component NrfD
MRQRPNANPILEFILGMILVLAIQIIVVVLSIALIYGSIAVINLLRIQAPSTLPILITGAPTFFIGVTQIAYLVPLCAYFANRRRYEVSKGIIVAAIVTLLPDWLCRHHHL